MRDEMTTRQQMQSDRAGRVHAVLLDLRPYFHPTIDLAALAYEPDWMILGIRPPGAIREAVVARLAMSHYARRLTPTGEPVHVPSDAPPPRDAADVCLDRALEAIEVLEHHFSPDVDLRALAREWSTELGYLDKRRAVRRVAARLALPDLAARLTRTGRPVRVDPLELNAVGDWQGCAETRQANRAAASRSTGWGTTLPSAPRVEAEGPASPNRADAMRVAGGI